MLLLLTLLSSAVIGSLYGSTGIGGILLPPAMSGLLGLDTHMAMGTSLASFILPMIFACWTHLRHGNLDWETINWLSWPGIVCVLGGTWLKACMSGKSLVCILAVLIIGAGLLVFRPVTQSAADRNPKTRRTLVAITGAAVGVLSGLTGAGGPVLSVPMLIIMGYAPLNAIVASQFFSLGISCTGTIGNALCSSVDFPLAFFSSIGQIAGLWAGLAIARTINTTLLKKLVAGLCIFTGIFLLARSLFLG